MAELTTIRVPVSRTPRRPPPPEVLDRRLTASEVAALLQVDVGTIYRHCRQGLLPHARVGSAIRISPGDLDVYRTTRARTQAAAGDAADRVRPMRPREPAGRFARLAHGLPVEDPPDE